MLSNQNPHTISTGITAPGAEEDQPYKEGSSFQIPGKINIRKQYRHIDHAKKSRHDLIRMVFRIVKARRENPFSCTPAAR